MLTTLALAAVLAAALPLPYPDPSPGHQPAGAVSPRCANGAVWTGAYDLNRTASDDLDRVAERAASQFGRMARGRVEGRLRERLVAMDSLLLSDDGGAVTIASEQGVLWRVNRDGTAEPGMARGQGSRSLQATVAEREIIISGTGEKGSGRYRITRSEDGRRLELAVSLAAERLRQPISYRLVYDRRDAVGGAP